MTDGGYQAGAEEIRARVSVQSKFDLSQWGTLQGTRGGGAMPWRKEHYEVNCQILADGRQCRIAVGSLDDFRRYREGQQLETTVEVNKPAGVWGWTLAARLYFRLSLFTGLLWIIVTALGKIAPRE